jgi:energy-coupling factor transport system ATP-binding protein
MEIKFDKVSYSTNNNKIINDISFNIEDKKITGLIGPSGSGKSTLAMLANGMIIPDSGDILYDNKSYINRKKSKINKDCYNIGLVFQFPEDQFFCDTVYKEIAFGLKFQKLDKKEVSDRVFETMKLLGIPESIKNNDPFTLSSGEKRLVALACVLVLNPKVLVLDEPNVGLDSYNKFNLIKVIKNINKKKKLTVLVISHDTDFLNAITDKIILINKGTLIECGDKYDLLSNEKLLKKYSIKVPNIINFENYALKKNIRLGYRNDINDLIKDILRNV